MKITIDNSLGLGPYWDLYNSKDELIGTINNVITFYDVRLQIKNSNSAGYYIKNKDGVKVDINPDGTLMYPSGVDLYDVSIDLLSQLLII